MTSRTLRITLAASTVVLALVAAASCTTSGNTPPDVVGPGTGGPGQTGAPSILAVVPEETCANAGNILSVLGANLVGGAFLSEVTINGVRADVLGRFDGSIDELTIQTRQQIGTIPATGLLVDVRVTNINGADTLVGGLRLLPACTGAPIVVSIDPSTGSRLGQDAITISGDNLACVTSVRFVGTRGAGTLTAAILAVISDQTIIVASPTTSNPSNEPYEVVVTSGCGTNAAPRPTFTYTGSGVPGSEIIPDATAIFDIGTGLPQGPAIGGNAVRITGRDLNLVTEISVGGTLLGASDFIVTAFGDIIINAMPPSPGGNNLTVAFNVTVSDGTNADTTPVVYTYLGAGTPGCTSISPNSGSIDGGTQVTITGTGLGDIVNVLFGGVAATGLAHPDGSGTRLLVTTPAYPAAIDVDVQLQIPRSGGGFTTVANCTPARFTYFDTTVQQFSVTGVAPNEGPQTGGTTITITGTGLTVVNSVRICNVAATIVQILDTQIIATTGAFGGVTPITCDVVVSTSTGLQATLTGAYTYLPVVPDAQSYDASSATTAPACGGTTFRLNGVNFIGGQRVRFGGSQTGTAPVACDVQFQSNTQVSGTAPRYTTPAGPFPADVNVVVESAAGGDTTPLTFRYYGNPKLFTARAAGGGSAVSAGDVVVLTGTNFRPENDVFVGSIELCSDTPPCASPVAVAFTVIDNNTINFVFPNLAIFGAYSITIRPVGGGRTVDCGLDATCFDTLAAAIQYGANPNASRVSPSTGPYQGGTTLTISGSFPLPVDFVRICGVQQALLTTTFPATSLTVLTIGVAEATAGLPCDVDIVTSLGTDTVVGGFTFVADPDPSSVEVATPNCGIVSTSVSRPVPVRAGQTLTIRGTDLLGVTKVTVGGAAATINEATRSDVALDVTVPAAPAGGPAFDIGLEVAFTSPVSTFIDTIPVAVQYQAAPTLATIEPAGAAAGEFVTLTGTALRNVNGAVTTVMFGAVPAFPLTTTDTAITLFVPAGVPGSLVLVTVSTCQGDATTTFTYPCNVPVVTGIAPSTGSGGTTVVITGTDLLDPSGTLPIVSFGASTAFPDPLFTQTATTLQYLAPTGSLGALVTVTVTTCGGTATAPQQFQYQCVMPTINSVSPSFGVAGTVVTISGINLDNPAGGPPTVRFGATSVNPLSSSGTSITVPAPGALVGTVDVSVQTCGGTATAVGAFTYCTTPTVTLLSPGSGPPDQLVTITGTSLQAPDGTPAIVMFKAGGISAAGTVVSSSPTSIGVQAPSGLTGVAIVTVQTCGGTEVTAGQFRFCTAPAIATIAPTFGGPGTQVVINGTNLLGADGLPSVVRFGTTVVTTIISQTSTSFVVLVPAGVAGSVSVDLTTCGGTAVAPQLFASCSMPAITGLVPTNGPAGTEVAISGTNLVGADGAAPTVLFGTTPAVRISSSPTLVVVVAPAGFANNQVVNVRVQTCGGSSAASPYTYQAATTCVAPTVSGISPAAGPVGSQLTITGTNLIGNNGVDATVTFGSPPVNAVVIAATPTTVVVTVPAGAGVVAVTATTCGGSATSPTVFRYCSVPTITSLVPSSGPAGATVFINGTNLVGADGVASTATFGATAAIVIDSSPTRLTVTAPAGFGPGTSVNVRATTCGGTALSGTLFTYVSTTSFDVTSITPASGPRSGGQLISISGTGLTAVTSISICGVLATGLTIVSDTQVTASTGVFNGSVPATCDVVVATATQTDTLVTGYTYLPAVPDGTVFDAVGAFTSPEAGGSFFRINGTNLLGVNKINFGGRVNDPDACNVQAPTDTYVTGVAPAYVTPGVPPGGIFVEVFPESAAGVDSTAVTAPLGYLQFKYFPNPRISSAAPSINLGGVPMTVTGTSLMDPTDRDRFVGSVEIHNAGFSHPDTYPEDEFDVFVPFATTNDTTLTFTMPTPPKGDTYKITIRVLNEPLACVDDYVFTLFGVFIPSESNCVDGLDDEGDLLIDCADGDCEGDPGCP